MKELTTSKIMEINGMSFPKIGDQKSRVLTANVKDIIETPGFTIPLSAN